MKLIKNLYLTDRFFYVLGTIIFLFFVSFGLAPVFYVSLFLLIGCALFLIVDIVLLFKQRLVAISREVPSVLSLSDKNKIVLSVLSKSNLKLQLKIIDEIPYQFNERDFSITNKIEPKKTETIHYYLTPNSRGEYAFGNMNVFIKTMIGLAAKKEVTIEEKRIAVYPSIIQMKQQELIALNHSSFTQGENKVRKMGKSYEFDQIKQYIS